MSKIKPQVARSIVATIVANAASIADKASKPTGLVIGKVKAKPVTVPVPVKTVVKAPAVKVVAKPKAKVVPTIKTKPVAKPMVKAPIKKAVAPDVITQAKEKLAQAVSNITAEKAPERYSGYSTPPAPKIQTAGISGGFTKTPVVNKETGPAKSLSWNEVVTSMKTAGSLKT